MTIICKQAGCPEFGKAFSVKCSLDDHASGVEFDFNVGVGSSNPSSNPTCRICPVTHNQCCTCLEDCSQQEKKDASSIEHHRYRC